MKKYKCSVCGHEYDPEVGDPDGGIEPGRTLEIYLYSGYAQFVVPLKKILKWLNR
jgi:hypothetical protein